MNQYERTTYPTKLKVEKSADEEDNVGNLIFDGTSYYPKWLKSKTEYYQTINNPFPQGPEPLILSQGQLKAPLIDQPAQIQLREKLATPAHYVFKGPNMHGKMYKDLQNLQY